MRHIVLSFLLAAAMALPVAAQTTGAPPPAHPTSTPYTGDLSIFEEPGRDRRLQIDRVMDLLGIYSGRHVADVGAGGGWFAVRAARRVGTGGVVYAEDINPPFVDAIRKRANMEKLPQIVSVLGTPDNPKLPPDSVDAVLMLKVYHEVAHPIAMLGELRTAMRPGAKLGVIDRNGSGDDHGLDERVLREEVEANGFRQVGRYTFTKADGQDYFLIFQKN